MNAPAVRLAGDKKLILFRFDALDSYNSFCVIFFYDYEAPSAQAHKVACFDKTVFDDPFHMVPVGFFLAARGKDISRQDCGTREKFGGDFDKRSIAVSIFEGPLNKLRERMSRKVDLLGIRTEGFCVFKPSISRAFKLLLFLRNFLAGHGQTSFFGYRRKRGGCYAYTSIKSRGLSKFSPNKNPPEVRRRGGR